MQQQHGVNAHFTAEAAYWANVYEASRVTSLIYTRRHDLALGWIDQLALPEGSPVAEIGCGAGRLAADMARRGLRVVAADSSPAMLDLTRAHAAASGLRRRISTNVADAHALPFDDGAFALVVALGVLPWLHSPRLALHEMARVLRPDGYAILTCDNRWRLDYFLDPRANAMLRPLRQRMRRPLRKLGVFEAPPNFQGNLLSRDEFATVLSDVGFDVLGCAPCGFGPFRLFGHKVLPARAGAAAQRVQQRLADRDTPVVRSVANQYVAWCRRARNDTPPGQL